MSTAARLQCQHLCSCLAARYLLQLYCSLATSYCGSFGDLLYFDYICGLHYHNPQRGVNMLASIASSFSWLQCLFVSALLRQCSICCNISYGICRSVYAHRLCFLLGSTIFTLWILVLPATLMMAIYYWLSCLVFFSAACIMLQRTNHSEPFANLVL